MPKKEKQGIVVSNKMDKTVVVKVASYEPHPKYKKIMEFNKVIKRYKEYKENEWIDDNKKVFMTKAEIISLNEDLK